MSICDNCEVIFNDGPGVIKVIYPACPAGLLYPGFNKNHAVRRVIVTAPRWKNVCDETSREAIAWSQYSGAIFPSATNLVIMLNKSIFDPSLMADHPVLPTPSPDTVGWCKGVVDFARALLRMTPAVTGVSVVAFSADAVHKSNKGLCAILLSVLHHGGVTRLDFKCTTDSPTGSLRPHMMTGLTSITHGINVPCSPIARLAYYNAPTLRELHIVPTGPNDWSSLITCGKLAPASYTSLVSLSMVIINTSLSGWTTAKGAIPFPVLSRLVIGGAYPFADDTLFRGNRGTLQKLSISCHALTRNALGRSGLFEPGGLAQLNPIHTILVTGEPYLTTSTGLISEQLHRVLESSTVLKLNCHAVSGNMFSSLCTAPSTAILRHLTLYNRPCTLNDVVSIVSALPSLVSLTCRIKGSATRIGLIPENESPGILHGKHYPLSRNFRVLHVPSVKNADIGKVSIVAMQIAVVCPSFAYMYLPLELRKGFRGKVNWSSRNGPFKLYGDALRRLIT
ncbi:hypothetical protein GGH13_003635 [Coemansia sp. S155-1]|nr:hypothetical protein GGH13_003635 [Coemansia sp. S155-1]